MRKLLFPSLFILMVIFSGCSGTGQSPTLPDNEAAQATQPDANRVMLGFWQMVADPDNGRLDVVELREVAVHINALRFLEPPPYLYLTIESAPVFSGNQLDIDIGLRHPFLGLNQFTGFDVCGVLITSGSMSGYEEAEIVIAGEGDTRLLNADGLTRWWNPREFPCNPDAPGQGYIDGLLGQKDDVVHYTSTLNGYKYFADALGLDAPAYEIDPDTRGYFSAGQQNIRHYTLSLEGGLVFNYAVDACWAPAGVPPYQIEVPESFPKGANRPEPFFISTGILGNTLWYKDGGYGGSLSLQIDVYDWFEADLITVKAECPGVFSPASSNTPLGGGANYSTYQIDLTNPTLASDDDISILISGECEAVGYQGILPGKLVAGYAPLLAVEVEGEEPSQVTLIWHDEGLANSDGQPTFDDIEPALTLDGQGLLRLSFFWWEQNAETHWWNYPRFVTSTDEGLTFGPYEFGQWHAHGVSPDKVLCYNGKYTVGPNGQAWHSYRAPCGHTLHPTPTFEPYTEAASHSGTPMEHAGEMLYTSEGYPMMFGDSGYQIKMRRGDYPNQGGTGTWPTYQGTPYDLAAEGWLSIVRSTGKTSDGICHLVYWREGVDGPIRMLSSDDITGTSWTKESIIQDGMAEIWVGAHDPSLWIDEADRFHVAYVGETWMGIDWLVCAYQDDEGHWQNQTVNSEQFDDNELNDTGVVTISAFDVDYVFIAYEYYGEVWCQYAELKYPLEMSDPIKVNVHNNATLPDLYPNGGNGVVFAYEADGDTDTRDIFYRMCEFTME